MPGPHVIEKVKDTCGQIVKIDPFVSNVTLPECSVTFISRYSTDLVLQVKEESFLVSVKKDLTC